MIALKNFGPTLPARLCVALIICVGLSLACYNSLQAKEGKGKERGHDDGHGKSADFIPPGHRRAPVEIIVKAAPPALRVETRSAPPSERHVWVAGYWVWEANAYVWTPAIWLLPPEPAAIWVAPRHEQRSGVTIYISGFWRI